MNSIRQTQQLNKRELESAVSTAASWHADYRDTAYIYIGGFPFDLSEGDIITIFSQYGNPTHLNLIRDRETGKSKGFAFLKYEDQRSCDLAVDNLGGADVLGRMLRVDHTRYKRKDGEDEETFRIDGLEEDGPKGDGPELDDANGSRKRASDMEETDDGDTRKRRKRDMLPEERELAQLMEVREGEEEDPMRQYLIQQKKEEVKTAIARIDKKSRHRRKPRRDRDTDRSAHPERKHGHRHRHHDDDDDDKNKARNRPAKRHGSRDRSHLPRSNRHSDSDSDDERRRRRYAASDSADGDQRHRNKPTRTINKSPDGQKSSRRHHHQQDGGTIIDLHPGHGDGHDLVLVLVLSPDLQDIISTGSTTANKKPKRKILRLSTRVYSSHLGGKGLEKKIELDPFRWLASCKLMTLTNIENLPFEGMKEEEKRDSVAARLPRPFPRRREEKLIT